MVSFTKISILAVVLFAAILPLLADEEVKSESNKQEVVEDSDGPSGLGYWNEMAKRYRLGKRDDDNEDSSLYDLEKRYRLMGKRYRLAGRSLYDNLQDESDDEEIEDDSRDKRYRLGKRYRLMGRGKRYRLMGRGKRLFGDDDDDDSSIEKRYRLGKRYRLAGK